MNPEWIGWAAAAVLLATMVSQVAKQWKSGVSAGISKWMFIGQTLASLGFTVYSYLQDDPVFLWVNLFMLLNAVVGQGIVMRNRRRQKGQAPQQQPQGMAAAGRPT